MGAIVQTAPQGAQGEATNQQKGCVSRHFRSMNDRQMFNDPGRLTAAVRQAQGMKMID
jgi:hypothetical protein